MCYSSKEHCQNWSTQMGMFHYILANRRSGGNHGRRN